MNFPGLFGRAPAVEGQIIPGGRRQFVIGQTLKTLAGEPDRLGALGIGGGGGEQAGELCRRFGLGRVRQVHRSRAIQNQIQMRRDFLPE